MIKLFTILVIIGVLYFLLFNNIYLFDINILYIKITIIENIKKISGIKNKRSFKKKLFMYVYYISLIILISKSNQYNLISNYAKEYNIIVKLLVYIII